MTVELNINRLIHVLKLYNVSKEELLYKLNAKRKNFLTEKDVFTEEIKLSTLKKIDGLFNKGIAYYLDPKNVTEAKEESIFFRKDNFNADLNLGAKQIVNRFEEEKIAFSTLAKLSDFKLKREVPVYKVNDNPEQVALVVREILYPEFAKDKKDFLKNFIYKLADHNILVFEFVETHNKIEKANINGFYLAPNVIVLKRNQKSFRREIFTLAHELGHYLLNEEEIDENVSGELFQHGLSKIEKWCNDFAYHFLAGDFHRVIKELQNPSSSNDYFSNDIEEVSERTHLSTIALYTRLLINHQISPTNYRKVVDSILESIKNWEAEEKLRLELEKQKAIDEGRQPGGRTAKPIISPLYLKTLRSALYTGLINESEFCKRLRITPEKVNQYIA